MLNLPLMQNIEDMKKHGLKMLMLHFLEHFPIPMTESIQFMEVSVMMDLTFSE
ncbi:hypothetical protein D3C80_1838490 [compost metagenome]